MATQEGSTALLQFGTTTVSGYVVEGITENRSSETLTIFDEDGDARNHIHSFGEVSEVSLSVIPETGTATPSIGDTITYTSGTDGASQKFILESINSTEAQKDVVKWEMTGKKHPNITLT